MTLDKTTFPYPKGEVFRIEGSKVDAEMSEMTDSGDIFDEDGIPAAKPLPFFGKTFYIPFGQDDELPFHMIQLIGKDEIMSQNKYFNVLTCYGSGLQYKDYQTGEPTKNAEIRRWMLDNSLPEFFLEQATDMKYFFFSVAVVILSKDGSRIVQVRHKESCYCRFEQADSHGRINHIFYANWRKHPAKKSDIESIMLLDEKNPLGHLEVLMGRAPGADGLTKERTKARKFAILVRYPTPGLQYYPVPYYTAIFRGDWFDIKRLIGIGKKAKLKNHASVKYQVEVHKDFWYHICEEEHISDPLKIQERIKKEKENIKNFVAGIENSGKVWITGYYIDPNGNENRMVRINTIDAGKEGGDWSEDIQEAANMTCYGDNIHPNLVGATPGKSQSNNSGSDKRELFTLKQSLEKSWHDLMLKVHQVIIYYNGWQDKVEPDVPLIMLNTLDQHNDAKQVSLNKTEEK